MNDLNAREYIKKTIFKFSKNSFYARKVNHENYKKAYFNGVGELINRHLLRSFFFSLNYIYAKFMHVYVEHLSASIPNGY